jgi:hypothetical protein
MSGLPGRRMKKLTYSLPAAYTGTQHGAPTLLDAALRQITRRPYRYVATAWMGHTCSEQHQRSGMGPEVEMSG